MTNPTQQNHQKFSLVWSSKQERAIPVRISYRQEQLPGCRVYTIKKVEELK
jgi:hypothetical protein